ncbi:D-alanyl-D-alanine carboxypeptidase/D-alanyl-D-alanine-endopeptidase [Lysinibacillus telephonicus]|uniref:D-alanyl-D-alanine carboxypeptidase/D-alanyl-D-alanine-endopeptidase n=1 Tax=Lysinibacillus telephonicus TaxID=1714840 RepID=A0A431UI74_9BACI|nr:D-alanyl-D-alanine carboxypeptidase/D-alanyl-D-alanine-endopeptidase [Lysinibacillus telephonicus]RTQ89443.1 D-alanyl-D-alanine carboxypeptidase/D-alanyl-D-alanine-endopeptidase [Lysinibacillus telephonicus]
MKKKLVVILLLTLLLINHDKIVSANSNLENIVQSQLGNDNISVSVRSLETGEVIYMKNGDVGMKPASTLKLLTAAAALNVLGSNYRFDTMVYIDGLVVDGVLRGDVYIKGGGDPTLQKKDFVAFADTLMHQGIKMIDGNLYGDDTLFSGPQLTPGVASADESYYFASRTAALTMSPDNDYDAGTIIIDVSPSSVGRQPIISARPNESGMIIQNNAVTVNANQSNTIQIERQYRTNTIVVTGNIPIGSSFKDWVTLYDPTINTLHAIKNTFRQRGIDFLGNSAVDRKEVPADASMIYTKHSLPLKVLINPFLKLSNNSIADILIKTLGKEASGKGTTEAGVSVLKDYGIMLGLDANQWSLEDGSGISHNNRVTANELTKLLFKMQGEPNYKEFYAALPIGGEKDRLQGGSLSKRFNSKPYTERVVAKTGSISGVYTLAGYVKAASGQTYAFAIMTQNQSSIAIPSIDEVVKYMINSY